MCNPLSLRLTSPQEMTRAEWTAAAVGTVLVISGIALAILALVRPDLLTHAVGTIVKDPLLIAYCGAGASILGGAVFMAMAVIRKNQAIEADVSQPEAPVDKPKDVTECPEGLRRLYELDPREPDFVKKSFHGKITISALFADAGALLERIPDYDGELLDDGRIDPTLMKSHSITKGKIKGDWRHFIAFKMACVSDKEKIEQKFPCRDAQKPAYMIVYRDGDRWVQRWTPSLAITPSFLRDKFESADWGGTGETENTIRLQEQGFNTLKSVMKGYVQKGAGVIQDNNGLEWILA